jgi:hypothetical protein
MRRFAHLQVPPARNRIEVDLRGLHRDSVQLEPVFEAQLSVHVHRSGQGSYVPPRVTTAQRKQVGHSAMPKVLSLTQPSSTGLSIYL